MPSPTHHRAVAVVLAILLALGLARHRPASAVQPVATRPSAHDASARIDPNTADFLTLIDLPGIGPTLARRILAARAAGTRFRAPSDLAHVRGLGPAHIARIAARLTFATDPPSTARPPSP